MRDTKSRPCMSTKKAPMRPKKDKKMPQAINRGQNKDKRHQKFSNSATKNATELRAPKNSYFIWGHHAIAPALQNPKRRIKAIYAAAEALPKLEIMIADLKHNRRTELPDPKIIERHQLDMLPTDSGKAVHQGLAVALQPLDSPHLEDYLADLSKETAHRLMILDQVSDPRNIGAILRSARAFGTSAIILQDRHAPEETGTLARTAVGALEDVTLIRVVNLTRAIEALKEYGFHIAGLDMDGSNRFATYTAQDRLALVMGSEGKGMRRLVREACDDIIAISMADSSESLNVSVAASIVMHATQPNEKKC